MSKPKNWDSLTPEAQEAWREKKRVYERNRTQSEKAKNYGDEWRKANREKMAKKKHDQYNKKPEVIAKRMVKEQTKQEKIERRRMLNAQNQRNRYARDREKVIAYKNEWRRKNAEKVIAARSEFVYREHLAEMEASGKKIEPAKLDMSKVMAFISKKDGPKSQKPITPNMAKVREFIKYA